MKAIVCSRYGPPEVLQLKEVKKPTPKAHEVLIRVHATAVTVSDTRLRGANVPIVMTPLMRLLMGVRGPRRSILGFVLAGEVDETGERVTLFRKGDQVYGLPGIRQGAYAEYACLPEAGSMTGCLALKPTTMSYEEAAAVPYGALLAMHFMRKWNIEKGQKVLVYGASGATGTTAVQLAKHAGAEVTAVCSTANLELVRSLGAEKTHDYTREDSLPDGELYDFVLDAVGRRKSSRLKLHCRRALTPTGKYASVDRGMPKPRAEYLVRMRHLIDEGHFRAVIDRSYPMEDIAAAHRYVDGGHKKGNVVITVVR